MPDPDPRDEVVYGHRALAGLADLLAEIAQCKQEFDVVGPSGLAELLSMVEARLGPASAALQDYVPRD